MTGHPAGLARARSRSARPAVTLSVAAAIALAVALAACTTPASSPQDVASPAEGVVIAVDATGLTQVRGFTIRAQGGQTLEFRLGTLENAAEFSPSHLTEHMASSEPIRVFFRTEHGDRVAYRLEDASV